jgi:hypothetical protein
MSKSTSTPPAATERRPLSDRQRTAVVALTWILGAVVLAALFAFKAVQTSHSQPLPHLGQIPTFTMRDQTDFVGKNVG